MSDWLHHNFRGIVYMKAKECVGGSIDHREWSRLVGDGQCPGRIPGRLCAQGHMVGLQTERLDDRMLPGVIARHPLGLILYTAGALFIAKWPLCLGLRVLAHTFVGKYGAQSVSNWIDTLTAWKKKREMGAMKWESSRVVEGCQPRRRLGAD